MKAKQLSIANVNFEDPEELARFREQGSGHHISVAIRAVVNQQLEAFIRDHVREGGSFCYETTLRTEITFKQARLAKADGFRTVILPRQNESVRSMRRV